MCPIGLPYMSDDQPTKPAAPAYRTLIPTGSAPTPSVPVKPAAKPVTVKPEVVKSESGKPEALNDSKDESRPDPTRFGDWEIKGRCIDF
jgi:hypothetical protein